MKFKIESSSTLFFFFFSLLAIAASRLWVASHSPDSLTLAPGFENYDLGIIGLMSKHVLNKGEFPFFFWGQDWFGGLEACLHEVSFWIFGVTPWAMRLVSIFLYSVFSVLTFLIGRELFDNRVAAVSLIWCLFPPLPWAYLSVVPHTHYLETPLLGSLILWLVIKLVKTSSRAKKNLYYVLWGFSSGVAWWVTPLSVYYLTASAAFVFLKERFNSIFYGFFLTLPLFLLGSLPWTIYLLNDPSVSLGSAGQMYGFHWERLILGLKVIFADVLPVNLDMLNYAEFSPWLAFLIGLFYVLSVLFFFLYVEIAPVVRGFNKERKWTLSHSPFLLFVLFSLGIAAGYSELAPGRMTRYLIPLYSFFPIAIAYAVVKTGKARYVFIPLFSIYLIGQGYFFWNWGQNIAPRYEEKARRVLNLIEKLKEKKISHAYIDRWLGPAEYTFMAKEQIIFSGPHHERYQPYELLLDQARNPAFIYKKPDVFKPVLQTIGGQCSEFTLDDYHVYYDFQEPAGFFFQIPVDQLTLKASHNAQSVHEALDRDLQTSWSSMDGKAEGMWMTIDVGKTRNLGLLRLWNKGQYHSNYPGKSSLEVSQDAENWDEIVLNQKSKPFYWSGSRIYFWEWSYRWEIRFGPVQARFVRLKLKGDSEKDPWMVTDLYVYERGKDIPFEKEREEELLDVVQKMKLRLIYADRYMNARIREASGGLIKTIEPFAFNIAKFVNKYSYRLEARFIRWTPGTGFVLEYSDAAAFRDSLRQEGISMSEINFGRWSLFYFSRGKFDKILKKNTGWYWTGLGMVRANYKQSSDYFSSLGKAAEVRKDGKAAILSYQKALSLYENHQEARRSLIRLLNVHGISGESENHEKILLDQTEPKNRVEAEFKNGVCFLGYSLESEKAAAGAKIPVRYFWSLKKDPGRGLGVFVHVEKNSRIFQGDHLFMNRHPEVWPALEGEIFHQDEILQIPQDVLPGDYVIYLGLFDVRTGKRVPLDKSPAASRDHRICIGRIKIVE